MYNFNITGPQNKKGFPWWTRLWYSRMYFICLKSSMISVLVLHIRISLTLIILRCLHSKGNKFCLIIWSVYYRVLIIYYIESISNHLNTIFFLQEISNKNFQSLYLEEGKIVYSYNCILNLIFLEEEKSYSDDSKWILQKVTGTL